MAMLHYQFEAIHPFSDGNGRTGRILNVLYLCKEKLIDLPVIYLSKFILDNKNDYYKFLREVTENKKWESWILFMLDGVNETAKLTLHKVNAIYEEYLSAIEKVKEKAPDIYTHELIEVIFNQPYCKIAILEEKKIASRNTASKYLETFGRTWNPCFRNRWQGDTLQKHFAVQHFIFEIKDPSKN